MKSGSKKGIIFNTQKFSIHDGIGIRTLIFMKGCPLKCLWCSNPESQASGPEIMDVKSNCVGCGKCAALCENHAVNPQSFDIDRSLCGGCGKCAEKCYANAKKIIGRELTVREAMEIIEKDRIFYTNSGGGVTIGGGEPTLQYEFVEELTRICSESNIHTAIETCGYGKWENIGGIFNYTDQIFFDLKVMDPKLHEKLTGVTNELILQNARKVAEKALERNAEIIFRIPLVPGCNDSTENIQATGEFAASLDGNIAVEILPYHDLGKDKYSWLNVSYSLADVKKPEEKDVNTYKRILTDKGCNVI